MQQNEHANTQAESAATAEDNRKVYEAPTLRTLGSSETRTGVLVTPDSTVNLS